MRYSPNTIKTYISMIELFFRFHHQGKIQNITKKNIEVFNNEYIIKNNFSSTFQNQLINVINLYNEIRLHLSLNFKTPNMVYKLSA